MTSGDQDSGQVTIDKKKEIRSWINKHSVDLLLLILVGILATGMLYMVIQGYNSKNTPVIPQSIIVQQLPPLSPVIQEPIHIMKILSIEEQNKTHEALARSLRINESCYDEKTDIWFVYATTPPLPTQDDNWLEGWYFAYGNDISVLELGNDTWVILNSDELFNDQITPDITGLNCKPHVPHK